MLVAGHEGDGEAEQAGYYFEHSPVCMHAAVEMFAQQCITLHGMLLYRLQPVVMLKEINNGRPAVMVIGSQVRRQLESKVLGSCQQQRRQQLQQLQGGLE